VNAATLVFAAYMADPELAYDLDILMRAGRIQGDAAHAGDDRPCGWFWRASLAYAPCDDAGRLARMACALVACELARGVPS